MFTCLIGLCQERVLPAVYNAATSKTQVQNMHVMQVGKKGGERCGLQ